MRPRPFLTAIGAGAGTILTMGAATAVVSGVALNIVKRVVRHRKMQVATACGECGGSGYLRCTVCNGKAVIRCREPVPLRLLGKKQKGAPSGPHATAMCSCPACGTTLQQRCLNCLGQGRVCQVT